jgi:hypothetical protein
VPLRRIKRLALVTLVGAVLAIGTHAGVARADYAEIASVRSAQADALPSTKQHSSSRVLAASVPPTRPLKLNRIRFAQPRAVHSLASRRLYLLRHAFLL